jgi:hypothetical protein
MKKLIIRIIAICSIVAISSSKTAEARPYLINGVVYGDQCCDGNGYPRCIINMSLINTACVCYGISGYGYVC